VGTVYRLEIFEGRSQMKSYTIQPMLKNEHRDEVREWCLRNFGPMHGHDDDQYIWLVTSNYNREDEADFDIKVWNEKYANWCLLKFGGRMIIQNDQNCY
jgi:hypothetical protein